MPTVSAAVGFTVEVDGQAFDQTTQGSVVEIVVDGDLKQPDTFAITLRENPDPSQGIAEQAHLRIGSKVKISGSSQTDQSPVTLISGEVTSLEAVYQQGHAPRLIARGYDLSHRLARGQKTKTFANMKFSDIAQQVATAAGLQAGTIDDSGAVYDQCGQVAENDWDFVRGLARSIGFECLVDDDKLHFRKPVQASSGPGTSDLNSTDPLQLVWGQELMDFRPRVTSAGQVSQVQVRGWDPESKQAVVGTAAASAVSAALSQGPGDLAGLFGSPTLAAGDNPTHHSQAEVDKAASARAEAVGSTFAEAQGMAVGNPRLKAGAAVSISLVAAQFAGRYTLTRARHVYNLSDGYRTHFTISGRHDRSILGLVTGASASTGRAPTPSARIYGVAVGIVTDNADPKTQGRVKVKLPWLSDDYASTWAPVAYPGAGNKYGIVAIPEVQDEVLVAFENGDPEFPYVLGGLYNGQDAIPPGATVEDGAVTRRVIRTKAGHAITLIDKSGSEAINIASADSNLMISFDQANGDLKIVNSASGKVKVTAQGDIELNATGSIKLHGSQGVEISSDAQAKLSGSSGVEVSSSGTAKLSGSMVQLG